METRQKTIQAKNLEIIEKIKQKAKKDPVVYLRFLTAAAKKNNTELVQLILAENPVMISATNLRDIMLILIKNNNFIGFKACGDFLKSIETSPAQASLQTYGEMYLINNISTSPAQQVFAVIQTLFQEDFKPTLFDKKTSLQTVAAKRSPEFIRYLIDEQFFNESAIAEICENIGSEKISVDTARFVVDYAAQYQLTTIAEERVVDHALDHLITSLSSSSRINSTTLEKLFLLFDKASAETKKSELINSADLQKLNKKFLEKCKRDSTLNPRKIPPENIAFLQAGLVRKRAISRQNDLEKNEKEAKQYLEEAAKYYHPAACEDLALSALSAKNYLESLDYLEKAKKNSRDTDEEKAAYILKKIIPAMVKDEKNPSIEKIKRSEKFKNYLRIYGDSQHLPHATPTWSAATYLMLAHCMPSTHQLQGLAFCYQAYIQATNHREHETADQAKKDIYNHFLREAMLREKITADDINFLSDSNATINEKLIKYIVAEAKDKKDDQARIAKIYQVAIQVPGLVEFAMDRLSEPVMVEFLDYLKTSPERYKDFEFGQRLMGIIEVDHKVSSPSLLIGASIFTPKTAPLPPPSNNQQELLDLFMLSPEEKKLIDEQKWDAIKNHLLAAYRETPSGHIDFGPLKDALQQVRDLPELKTTAETPPAKEILLKVDQWLEKKILAVPRKGS